MIHIMKKLKTETYLITISIALLVVGLIFFTLDRGIFRIIAYLLLILSLIGVLTYFILRLILHPEIKDVEANQPLESQRMKAKKSKTVFLILTILSFVPVLVGIILSIVLDVVFTVASADAPEPSPLIEMLG